METSTQKHTKEENTANTIKPENTLKTVEQTIDSWGRRKDDTEKGEVAEPLLTEQDPSLAPPQPIGRRKKVGAQRG